MRVRVRERSGIRENGRVCKGKVDGYKDHASGLDSKSPMQESFAREASNNW
jgi:hypothetical protein